LSVRKLIAACVAVAVGVGAKLGLDRLRKSGPQGQSIAAAARRRGRHTLGRARGLAYRALRRHPDTDVDDATLADRVRSSLGPLEKRLQVPRVHVTVENGVVILHGETPNSEAAAQIVNAVEGIAGVRGVRSHLGT
jgi:osmotically-inducible protein OsmY